jgi:uncharacterized repeat protein (TIGR01451 family)
MSRRIQALKPQYSTKEVKGDADPQRAFFVTYASIPALAKEATKKGEALELFHSSRSMLESLLKNSGGKVQGSEKSIPIYHSLLSMIYWLYPNYVGYNRMKNALAMFRHAKAATFNSANSSFEAYVTGLFVQLRVLPFLIRSKKVDQKELTTARELALVLVESSAQKKSKAGPLGLVLEALGFSYYQLEHDKKNALSYLSKSVEFLGEAERQISEELKESSSNSRSLKAKYSFFHAISAVAYNDLGMCYHSEAESKEGQEMLSLLRITRSHYQRAYDYAKRTPWHFYKGLTVYNLAGTFANEGEIEIEKEKAVELLKKAVNTCEESLQWLSLWSSFESDFVGGLGITSFYQKLAKNSGQSERKKLMQRSMKLALKAESVLGKKRSLRYNLTNLGDVYYHNAEYYKDLASNSKSASRTNSSISAVLLERALSYCMKGKTFYREERYSNRAVEASLLASDICYELISIRHDDGSPQSQNRSRYANMVRRLCNSSIKISERHGWNERVAESNWHLAQVMDKDGRFNEAANYYERAHEAYVQAMSTTPKALLYKDLAFYMLAWNKMEKAKIAHRASDFTNASKLYSEAARLVEKSRRWRTSSQLYLAESLIESAENVSLSEKTQESIDLFNQAAKSISNFMAAIKTLELDEKLSYEELANELLTFCNARVILEKSKESYRIGDVQKSILGLEQAGMMFEELAKDSLVQDVSRSNELESLASLCAALTSFQKAQLTSDSKLFLEAQQIFGEAALRSTSKSLKPLLLGLASFAEFLYSSKKVEESLGSNLDIVLVVECNKALDNAEVMFRKLGNKSFLSMLRASKHILDASIKMAAADREVENTQEKARLYSQSQRSLSLAARYYKSLGSSKKLQESIQLMSEVKNHQKLIPLAHDIFAEVAANQIIYAAISSSTVFEQTAESSSNVLNSAYVMLDVELSKPYIQFGEEFSFAITMMNLGRETAITVKINDVIPEGFDVTNCSYTIAQDRSLALNTRIEPSSSKQISVTLRPTTQGEHVWNPSLVYLDAARKYRITKTETAKIVVESEINDDISALVKRKNALEAELSALQAKGNLSPEGTEKVYSIKEEISKIEEVVLRARNEFANLNSNLTSVRSELSLLNPTDPVQAEAYAKLKVEESVLLERIERRSKTLLEARLS